jgi:hypothetical protein
LRFAQSFNLTQIFYFAGARYKKNAVLQSVMQINTCTVGGQIRNLVGGQTGWLVFPDKRVMSVVGWRTIGADRVLVRLNDGYLLTIGSMDGERVTDIRLTKGQWYTQVGISGVDIHLH